MATPTPSSYPSPSELGYAQDPILDAPIGILPPGGGRFPVAHYSLYAGTYNAASRTYGSRFDEALRHSWENARIIRRDDIIMRALRARQMPTAQLSWHIDAADLYDEREVEAAQKVTEIIERIPRWQEFLMQLLEAQWYGKYACALRYQYKTQKKPNPFRGDGLYCTPTGHLPINGDKLRIKWDGSVGIITQGGYGERLENTDFAQASFLTREQREAVIVHRFEPEDADYLDGDMAGVIAGRGFRDRLYWLWFLKTQVLAQCLNYVERYCTGTTVYYYDAHNPQARVEMEKQAREQHGNSVLFLPRWSSSPNTNGVDRLDFGTGSPQFLQSLVENYFDDRIETYILGAPLRNLGYKDLVAGAAAAYDESLGRRLKYDTISLQETLQTDFVNVLYKYNCPGITPGRFKFDIDTPNATEVLQNAGILYGMGLPVDADHLYTVAGLPQPAKTSTVAAKSAPMTPSGLEQGPQPTGVPSVGEPVTAQE
jgi:hypothetical protein